MRAAVGQKYVAKKAFLRCFFFLNIAKIVRTRVLVLGEYSQVSDSSVIGSFLDGSFCRPLGTYVNKIDLRESLPTTPN